MICETKTLKM